MKNVSVFDFRDNLAKYLSFLARTETPLVVKRYTEPVAIVFPYEDKYFNIDKYFGFLGGSETGTKFVNRIRRSKKERLFIKRYKLGK